MTRPRKPAQLVADASLAPAEAPVGDGISHEEALVAGLIPVEHRAPDDEQPIALAEAEEKGTLPEQDRRAPEPDHGLTVYPIG